MARKTKYNAEMADHIVEHISQGYTLKDTAYLAGISDETIRRWRNHYPEFNKRVVEASNRQWDSQKTLIKYQHPEYRSYRRPRVRLSEYYGPKQSDTHLNLQKPLRGPLSSPKRQFLYGLPVRPHAPDEWVKTPPYFNLQTQRVEWISKYPPTGRLVLTSCTLVEHLSKQAQTRQSPITGMPCIVVV